MNKKKILGIALIVVIFLGLMATIFYIFTELKEETDINLQQAPTTDAKKFKNDYEVLNDQDEDEEHKYRSVSINENNPIKYVSAEDIVKKIDNKETFIVYFGFDSCPWCRSIIEQMLASANEYNISTIYYVDVKGIRDVYTLNDKNEAERTTEGTADYYNLLDRLDNILSDYAPLTYKETKKVKGKKTEVTAYVELNEKRIYAPNIILVEDGEAKMLVTGISSDLTDPYMELTDEIKEYEKKIFDGLFKEFNNVTTTTTTITTTQVTGETCDGPNNC